MTFTVVATLPDPAPNVSDGPQLSALVEWRVGLPAGAFQSVLGVFE